METHDPNESGASGESGDPHELPVVEFFEPGSTGQVVHDFAGEGPHGAEFVPVAPPIALPTAPPVTLVASPPISSPPISSPPVANADSLIVQDPPGIVPVDDLVDQEDRLRDSASFAGSALIHSAALVVLAVFTSATIKREAVVWIAEPASPVVDTPLLEPVQVAMSAESNSVANALSNAAQAEIPAQEMTVATAELVADEPMLGDVDQAAHASTPGSADRDRAPVDRLLDVVATRKKTTSYTNDAPEMSPADSPLAMARAATVGVPHWGGNQAERVVYRFILYDIGRLHGLEAAEAQFAFSSLPNEALPELIKGLNASAYLQASCPVVVLSSRVQSSLASLNSREAYEYALKNIGKGVPANANYAAHLASLRQRLAAESGISPGANPGLMQPLRMQRSRWVMQLQHASSSRLTDALASENADERWAATRVVAARGLKLMDELIPLLADEDIMVREEAHAALVRLARGIDLGPVNSGSESEVDESIDLWRRWSSQNKERQGVSEYTSQQDEALRLRRANNRISLAEKLLADGHSQAANRYLEEVIRDYPGTASADRAEELKRGLAE